jgi:hypothetical protein
MSPAERQPALLVFLCGDRELEQHAELALWMKINVKQALTPIHLIQEVLMTGNYATKEELERMISEMNRSICDW